MPESTKIKTEMVQKGLEAPTIVPLVGLCHYTSLDPTACGLLKAEKRPKTALKRRGLSLSRKNRTCHLRYLMIHNPNILKKNE